MNLNLALLLGVLDWANETIWFLGIMAVIVAGGVIVYLFNRGGPELSEPKRTEYMESLKNQLAALRAHLLYSTGIPIGFMTSKDKWAHEWTNFKNSIEDRRWRRPDR